ncbi:unnamed protein product [Echinostoma caproni]|uniref:CA domain-containing protein n=1 Tax=Echinostoma caproni TaxID=27848 RepID=A0A183A7X2_9TREM|nr:unnamed protein product [Echinostoma caproni]
MLPSIQLDREKQASYTFHVTVRDGPLRAGNSFGSLNEPNSQSVRRRSERSHLVSILVTVTVEDENDNDPVFVRPNSTNHMVLLDPAAIPGQSLLQLHAVDPDEGPNGHVTYAIRGGNAGNLFNVDPRTGLLYLENQIPRRTIAEATAAAAAAASAAAAAAAISSSQSANAGSDAFVSIAGSGAHGTGASDQAPTQPTYLLALEACDQGQPSRCTHFPNLQIQLRVPNDLTMDPTTGQLLIDGAAGLAGPLQLANGAGTRSDGYLGFGIGGGAGGPWAGGLSTAEILIISLSTFFALLILVIVITICVLKQRSISTSPDVRRKDLSALKRVGRSTVNNVELVDQGKPLRYGTTKVNITRMAVAMGSHPATVMGLSEEDRLCYAAHHQPVSRATMYGPTPLPEHYGMFSPTYSPKRMNIAEYQTLEGWSALDAQRYGTSCQQYPTVLSSPERRRYYTQPHMDVSQAKLSNAESYNTSPITESQEKPAKELVVDLIPSRQTSQSGLSDTATDLHTMVDSSAPSCSPRISHSTKAKLQAYAGFPKSSFV